MGFNVKAKEERTLLLLSLFLLSLFTLPLLKFTYHALFAGLLLFSELDQLLLSVLSLQEVHFLSITLFHFKTGSLR